MGGNFVRNSSVLLLVLFSVATNSLSLLQTDHQPLAAELSSRVAAHTPHTQDAKTEARLPLPLPSSQELDAIKKVAQLLVMLGGQVIPGIIGESPTSPTQAPVEVPPDAVSTT